MSDAPLMLSVSGMRGLVGKSLTPPVASRYAAAFGEWLKGHRRDGAAGPPHVVLGRDSRPSGQMIEMAAAAGLVSVGCRVTTLGIVTTPSVAIMADQLGADGGMVITASHNPIPWNGLKSLRYDGCAPPKAQAEEIIRRYHEDDVTHAAVEALHPVEHDESTHRVHVDRVLAQVDVELIRRRKLKVVLDSVHGAGGPAGAMLLRDLGVELIHMYGEPTGHFPHTPEPTRENLEGLCKAVAEHGADIGLAQDPDADRLAVVDERGEYIGEEYTLALCTLHALSREDSDAPRSVAANLSTSRMIDDIAAGHGAVVHRTPVGEANVAGAMREHNALIGGEGNGGVILPTVVQVRDSLIGAALLLEMLATREQSLSEVVRAVPAYAIVKEKVDVNDAVLAAMSAKLRDRFADQLIDLQDGVRIDWPDRWVHVRASNTEPIIRVIAEAPDAKASQDLVSQVRQTLGL